jgi:hypothetical protein
MLLEASDSLVFHPRTFVQSEISILEDTVWETQSIEGGTVPAKWPMILVQPSRKLELGICDGSFFLRH